MGQSEASPARRVLPAAFVEMIEALDSPVTDGLVEALSSTGPSVAVRYNLGKGAAAAPGLTPVAWSAEAGRYLDERPRFTLDPALHQGLYYVQDASSMFIGHVVKQLSVLAGRRLLYVDACAAPGGKTTAAIDALPEGSTVVANEIVPARAAVLRENVIKWGYPRAIVTRTDTATLARALAGRADIVAADVPCSGEGMMRKDAEAVAQWSRGLVAECAARQREIAGNLWEAVAPGGWLVYSTCTFNREENEEMARWIVETLGGEPVAIDTSAWPEVAGGIGTDIPCYRFLPGRVRGEGLFMAVFRKPGELAGAAADSHGGKGGKDRRKNRERRQAAVKVDVEAARQWIADPTMNVTAEGERVNAADETVARLAGELSRGGADVIHHGVPLATVKGRDLIPTQALAMSTALNREAFVRVEVDRATALGYLRRLAVALPGTAPRGYVLLTHGGYPLGFVKNLGNRANNLYPQAWRILS